MPAYSPGPWRGGRKGEPGRKLSSSSKETFLGHFMEVAHVDGQRMDCGFDPSLFLLLSNCVTFKE
jgi:hypothetical protein